MNTLASFIRACSKPFTPTLFLLIFGIIIIREVSMVLAEHLGIRNYGNLIGLFVFFILLKLYQRKHALSTAFLHAQGTLMKESAFAFLPFIAGVGSAVWSLGHQLLPFVTVLVLSTIIPLWIYAFILKKTPSTTSTSPHASQESPS